MHVLHKHLLCVVTRISKKKADLARSNSVQKSAAVYTCAEHVLTGQTQKMAKKRERVTIHSLQ